MERYVGVGRVLINAQIAAPLFPGHKHRLSEKLHSLLDGLWPRNCVHGPTAKPPCIAFTRRCSAPSHPGGGDDRVSGTDAERHDDIYHNGSSGFGCNADRAEMADLRPCTSPTRRSQSRCRVMFPDKTRLRRLLPRLQTKSKLPLPSR
jgi:hypothetical protein